MKQLLYTIAITFVLVTAGFVIVNFVLNKSQSKFELMAKQENAMPTALPTVLVGFPDIEYVPIYPNASVTFTDNGSVGRRHISYEVVVPMDQVAGFYESMLAKEGWHLRSSHSRRSEYSRINPVEKTLWHMHLEVTIDLPFDTSKTAVFLEYGRYPNIEEGLPLYPDAQQVTTTHSNIEKQFTSEKQSVRVTDVTYISSASPQEIADFYTSSMQEYGWNKHEPGWSTHEYGWFPFDEPGSWEGGNKPSDISSQEGLYFVAVRPSWGEKSGVVSYHLLATATVQEDGHVVIKLHAEEFESSLGNF